MTIMELVERYCIFRVLRPDSQTCYVSSARALTIRVSPEVENDIRLITTEMLLRFRADILKSGSPVSWNTHRNRLRTLFRFAIQDGALSANPMDRVGLAPVADKPRRGISTDVTRLIVSHLESTKPVDPCARFWIAVTKLLYYTGMRRRQLVGLCWGDINFTDRLLTLRADSSKTRREWDIPLPTDTVADLRWLQRKRLDTGTLIDPDMPVFDITLVRPTACPLNGNAITTYYWHLGHKLGVTVSPHRFRHGVATDIVNKTGNLRIAQDILGHADVKTTCGYVHPSMPAMRDAMQYITPLG